ncbi:hypothetical protein E2542_SST13919 [Spatholobus suberectus]|nr:hypothetical protein E2542_SST13919 [Spatholobus suberectus]
MNRKNTFSPSLFVLNLLGFHLFFASSQVEDNSPYRILGISSHCGGLTTQPLVSSETSLVSPAGTKGRTTVLGSGSDSDLWWCGSSSDFVSYLLRFLQMELWVAESRLGCRGDEERNKKEG